MDYQLTDEQIQAVDEEILAGRMINAIKKFREFTNAALYEAQNAVEARRAVLFAHVPEPTLDELIESACRRLKNLPKPAVVVEAIWDGDTQGWFVELIALLEDPSSETGFQALSLFILHDRNQVREIGKAIMERFGIPFYFPSPDFPEDRCPRWWQRDRAIPCPECGIPLFEPPNHSNWVGICFNCDLTLSSPHNRGPKPNDHPAS